MSADAAGHLTGHGEAVQFDAVPPGLSQGNCFVPDAGGNVETVAQKRWTTMGTLTPGMVNAAPYVDQIVISELMYHPRTGTEYLELFNRSNQSVALFDPAQPEYRWRLRGVDTYEFPSGTSLLPQRTLLVVPIEPEQFRQEYALGADIQIVGPYRGKLSNGGEQIILEKPGQAAPNGLRPYYVVDEVAYDDADPWPYRADGRGWSLERVNVGAFANSVHNWRRSEQIGGSPGFVSEQIDQDDSGTVEVPPSLYAGQADERFPHQSNIYLPLFNYIVPQPQMNRCLF
ncbi:lamin tail domain-containing protein [Chloroflexi bacterium TSY]|nr:lamin tail domain-containing protein [Chloroflexi bacterium TSY]